MEIIRIVNITLPGDKADDMAKNLVEKRLAACVNVIPKVYSFYWWEDEVREDAEALLVAKTTQQKVEKLINFVRETHPYKVPEVITYPVAEGNPGYISWVIEEMGKG